MPAYGNWLLLAASVIFYAKGGGAFTWLMLGSIAFNYWMAIAVDRVHGTPAARAARLAFAVTVNLVVLGIFKYANFFADNVNALLPAGARPADRRAARAAADRHLVLHLPRDLVRHRRLAARRDGAEEPGARGALPAAVPAADRRPDHPLPRHRRSARAARRVDRRLRLRRAPIRHRPRQEGADRQRRRRPGRQDLRDAVRASSSPAHAWLGIVCYTLQIYFDFSGYSDMAIGLGRMFGFRFPENFRWPYVGDQRDGVLAALAHLAVDLVPRLPLHPARRQPREPGAPLPQPGHRVLPVRPVARRELELRHLGPVARHRFWSSNASPRKSPNSPDHPTHQLPVSWPGRSGRTSTRWRS